MKLSKPNIPKELDADVAMSVIMSNVDSVSEKRPSYSYDFKGVSERTALGDCIGIAVRNRQNSPSSLRFSLKRDSLYHILPEYLFHPLDCYIGTYGDTEEFDKRYKEQEEQRVKALTYFNPFDQHFQQLRIKYQQWLNENIFSGNNFLSDFITEGHDVNLNNPFIKAVYPCIPWLRDFRGSDDMVRTALGYAFSGKAEIDKVTFEKSYPLSEEVPGNVGCLIGEVYCGETFREMADEWKVFYQTEIETENTLSQMKIHIREFVDFFTFWFIPLGDVLTIDFGDRYAKPELSESEGVKGVFLNYTTQLI